MNAIESSARPPKISAWFVELFASPSEADGILGDLEEEFRANHEHDGMTSARARYRHHALRTIRDLALAPWNRRGVSSALAGSGALLGLGLGIAGLLIVLAVGRSIDMAAQRAVVNFDVYAVVPATFFWGTAGYAQALIAGIVIALTARAAKIRPMSAALCGVVAMIALFNLEGPIMVLRYGQPEATWAHVTVFSTLRRVAAGLIMFGGPYLIGAAIGRRLPRLTSDLRLRRV